MIKGENVICIKSTNYEDNENFTRKYFKPLEKEYTKKNINIQ